MLDTDDTQSEWTTHRRASLDSLRLTLYVSISLAGCRGKSYNIRSKTASTNEVSSTFSLQSHDYAMENVVRIGLLHNKF